MIINIPVKPRGKGSVRGSGRAFFKDKQTKEYMDKVSYFMRKEWQLEPLETAIEIKVSFNFIGNPSDEMDKKPDIDNCLKALLDCATGIIWKDDCQIVKIYAEKVYSEVSEGTIILIEEKK